MNSFGTIYVLINPVMPGLIKIGKTKRMTQERIQELSSATGVPTQFILVYEQKFIDVDTAESQVHLILEERGFRLSPNREFFNAPVADAIKVIQSLNGQFNGDFPSNDIINDLDISTDDDEFGELTTQKNSIDSQPWAEFWYIAENYYYGLQNEIQDYGEAMAYYIKAIKAGCPVAYEKLGEMYVCGEGIARPDVTKALEFYKKGANVGDYYCYVKMDKLYLNDGNFENARKCIDRFVANRKINKLEFFEEERNIGSTLYEICSIASESNIISNEAKDYLASFKHEACITADKYIDFNLRNDSNSDISFVTSYDKKLNAIKDYILLL